MSRRARRNAARLTAVVLLLGSGVLLGTAGSAGANGPGATLAAKGWWWAAQRSSLPTPLPAPPNVQPGQLNVQGNPTDPKGTAFAAVRYTVAEGHSVGALTLKAGSSGNQGGSSAVLLACRTGSAWTPADAGSWDAAPKVDNTACVNGQSADEGATWTFAVAPLQLPGLLDIAIVPGVDPATKQPATFNLVFEQPSADSVTTSSGSVPTPTVSTGGTSGPATSGATSGSSSTATRPASTVSVPTGVPTDKVGQTATSPANQAATQPALDTAVNTAAPAKDRDKRPGIVVLVFAALVGLYAWRQDNLMAANGGRLPGDDEVSGLGRFARPRQGQPPALT